MQELTSIPESNSNGIKILEENSLDKAYQIVATFIDDLDNLLNENAGEIEFDAASVAVSTRDAIEDIKKHPDIYDFNKTRFFYVIAGNKTIAVSIVSVGKDHTKEKIKINNQTLKVDHVSLSVVVHPQYRNRGIGGTLIKRRLNFLKNKGIQKFALRLSEESQPIFRKYSQIGVLSECIPIPNDPLKRFYVRI